MHSNLHRFCSKGNDAKIVSRLVSADERMYRRWGGAEHDNRVAQESKYFKNKSTVIEVASILLEDIIQSTHSKRIDYLSIDIEGNEIQIILDVLKKYPNLIELFSLECNYTPPLETFKGYKNIYQAGVDYFFAKQ